MLMSVCDCSDWGITSVPESERIWANEIIPSAGERWAIFCKGDIRISVTKCQHCRPNTFHYQKPSWKQATKKLCELNPQKNTKEFSIFCYSNSTKITILDCKNIIRNSPVFIEENTPVAGGDSGRSLLCHRTSMSSNNFGWTSDVPRTQGFGTNIPAPPKRCQYDPKGWLMGTPAPIHLAPLRCSRYRGFRVAPFCYSQFRVFHDVKNVYLF